MSEFTGKAKGGKARAEKLTPEERSKIAKMGGKARWASLSGGMIKATHQGKLMLGNMVIDCYVLENGQRVIHKRGMARALGMKSGGGNVFTRTLQRKGLGSEVSEDLIEKINNPLVFKTLWSDPGHGYEADTLIDICDAIIDARNNGKLSPSQSFLAIQAESIIRSVAKVGMIALVDEATGYQQDREKDALAKLLAAYLSEERLKWASLFPNEFYKQMYRLRGWIWPSGVHGKPSYVGKLTNELVYERLPVGVLEELRIRNPIIPEKKRRAYVHTQFLSEDLGQPDLRNHLVQTVTLMKVSKSWNELISMMNKVLPKGKQQQPLLPGFE